MKDGVITDKISQTLTQCHAVWASWDAFSKSYEQLNLTDAKFCQLWGQIWLALQWEQSIFLCKWHFRKRSSRLTLSAPESQQQCPERWKNTLSNSILYMDQNWLASPLCFFWCSPGILGKVHQLQIFPIWLGLIGPPIVLKSNSTRYSVYKI